MKQTVNPRTAHKKTLPGMRWSELVRKNRDWIIISFLICSVWVGYWPVGRFGFIDFDDNTYVSQNLIVQRGLTWPGLHMAFTSTLFYYHPLTWLSHMLDCQLFETEPGPHHRVNVLLHLFNALLLYWAFRKMTGA